MNQVEYHLKLVINLWCGAVPTGYTIDSQLRDIWAGQVPNLDYDIYGIPRFMKGIYQDALFSGCPSAHNMTTGEFIAGGDLQTVRAVYVRLMACGNGTPLANVVLPFAKDLKPAKDTKRGSGKANAPQNASQGRK